MLTHLRKYITLNEYFIGILFSVSMLLSSPALIAQPVSDLYKATVSVAGSEETDRNVAMQQALSQVLVKLSGDRTLVENARVKAKLAQAEKFVEQFEYQTRPHDGQRLLVVSFDEEAIKQLLQDFGIAQWSNARPTLLVWIVLDAEAKQTIINRIEQPTEANILSIEATTRGVPILFPIVDLEDLRTLQVTDIIVGRREAIEQVARRYNVPTTWVGHVALQDETWKGQWHLLIGTEQFSWQSTANTLPAVLTKGIHETVDKVVKRAIVFATTPAENTDGGGLDLQAVEETFTLKINSLPSLDDYARVRDYLHSLDIIADLQIQQMQPGQATFRITVKGGKTALARALSLGHLLTPETTTGGTEVIYRFTASPW